MTRRLIIQSGDENVLQMLDLAKPFHRAYAELCGADYQCTFGQLEQGVPPAWNRIRLILDGFDEGYEQVLWLDADTLVVRPEVDVFTEASWDHHGRTVVDIGALAGNHLTQAFVLRRTAGGFYWPMDGTDQWEGWNDGVLLVNNNPLGREACEWWWDRRHDRPRPHHQPGLWELNWLLDWIKDHWRIPGHVAEMDQRFNWQPFNGSSPEQYAVIKAWHGLPMAERWEQMQACAALLAAGRPAVARVRDTTPGFVG